MKPLGQIAYEVFYEGRVSVPWTELPKKYRHDWNRAAEAVLKAEEERKVAQ